MYNTNWFSTSLRKLSSSLRNRVYSSMKIATSAHRLFFSSHVLTTSSKELSLERHSALLRNSFFHISLSFYGCGLLFIDGCQFNTFCNRTYTVCINLSTRSLEFKHCFQDKDKFILLKILVFCFCNIKHLNLVYRLWSMEDVRDVYLGYKKIWR